MRDPLKCVVRCGVRCGVWGPGEICRKSAQISDIFRADAVLWVEKSGL